MIVLSTASPAMETILNVASDLDLYDQVLGIYGVIKSLPFAQKMFLHMVLGQWVKEEKEANPHQCAALEKEANDTETLPKQPLEKLLTLLCLLQPEEAKPRQAFAQVIHDQHQQISASNDENKILKQHFFTIASIHPAFSVMDQHNFSVWASEFSSMTFPMIITTEQPSSPTTSSSPGSLSPMNSSHCLSSTHSMNMENAECFAGRRFYHQPLQNVVSEPIQRHLSVPRDGSLVVPNLSLTLSNGHHKLGRSLSSSPSMENSPTNSMTDLNGSFSNILIKDAYFPVAQPGMKDVPAWLKSLRLHKYCNLLACKSYSELIDVTEEQLEAWNVTKGARHKIAVSIQKLRSRPEDLRTLTNQLNNPSELRAVLVELRTILLTPIKITDGPTKDVSHTHFIEDISSDDLAAKITFVIKKAANVRLAAAGQTPPEDDCVNLLIQIIDRCLRHEAFYGSLRNNLLSMKQNLQNSLRPTGFQGHRKLVKSFTTSTEHHPHPFNRPQATGFESRLNIPRQTFFSSVPEPFAERPAHRTLQRTYALAKSPSAAVPNEDKFLKPKTLLSRARSAPAPAKPLTEVESNMWFDGVDPDLETLTLSVTEHALDSFEHNTF